MRRSKTINRVGFTLLELLAAVVVMSIISVTLMPVIASASDSYVVARQVRGSTERAAFALDRMTRVIRQAPIGEDETGVGILSSTASSVEFTDGSGFQLIGTTLELLVPGEDAVPLCVEVDSFEIRYIGDDGVTDVRLTPGLTHRFEIEIETQGVVMSVLAHPRVWIGQEDPS